MMQTSRSGEIVLYLISILSGRFEIQSVSEKQLYERVIGLSGRDKTLFGNQKNESGRLKTKSVIKLE